MPPIAQLIRRVADDDVKFHVEDFLWLVGMNEGVGVALQLGPSLMALFRRGPSNVTPGARPSEENEVQDRTSKAGRERMANPKREVQGGTSGARI